MNGSRSIKQKSLPKSDQDQRLQPELIKKHYAARFQNRDCDLGSEENCVFCMKKVRSSKFPLLIQKSLFARHSSSITYYYTKDINKLLREAKAGEIARLREWEMFDLRAEHLTAYYRSSDFPALLANQWRYHQFNIDQPRFFEKSLMQLIDAHFAAKRKLQEKAIRRMLEQLSDSELENYDLDLAKFMFDRVEIEERVTAQNDILKGVLVRSKAQKTMDQIFTNKNQLVKLAHKPDDRYDQDSLFSGVSCSSIKPYLKVDDPREKSPVRLRFGSTKMCRLKSTSSLSILNAIPSGIDGESFRSFAQPSLLGPSGISNQSREWGNSPVYPEENLKYHDQLNQVKSNEELLLRVNEAFSKAKLSNKQPPVLLSTTNTMYRTHQPKMSLQPLKSEHLPIPIKNTVKPQKSQKTVFSSISIEKKPHLKESTPQLSNHRTNREEIPQKLKRSTDFLNLCIRRDKKFVPFGASREVVSSILTDRALYQKTQGSRDAFTTANRHLASSTSKHHRENGTGNLGSLSANSVKKTNFPQSKHKKKHSRLFGVSRMMLEHRELGSIIEKVLKGSSKKKKPKGLASSMSQSAHKLKNSPPILNTQRLANAILKKLSNEEGIWPSKQKIQTSALKVMKVPLQIKPKDSSCNLGFSSIQAMTNHAKLSRVKSLKTQFIEDVKKGLSRPLKLAARNASPKEFSPRSACRSLDGEFRTKSEARRSKSRLRTCRSLKSEDSFLLLTKRSLKKKETKHNPGTTKRAGKTSSKERCKR